MAQGAAMLAGLVLLWFLLSPRIDAASVAIGVAVALVAAIGGRWLTGPARKPEAAPAAARVRVRSAGALRRILAGVLAPRRMLAPSLVKLRARDEATRAAYARAVAGAVGVLVVEVESDGLLLHVVEEGAVGAASEGTFR
jgi:multisubunit Na+/H+ antiporter MnhE subunit